MDGTMIVQNSNENSDDDDDDDDNSKFTYPIGLNTTTMSIMDLATALQDSQLAIDLFCKNKCDDALKLFMPWTDTSMYHSIGNSGYSFVESILTNDPESIQKASRDLDKTLKLCNTFRKKQTYVSTFKKIMHYTDYDGYSTEQLHAELLYAESLSLRSLITFFEDKSKTLSFLKAGFKMRTAFNCFKECLMILNDKQLNNKNYDIHFETGVRMGIGSFNLIISHLPTKIIRLLEWVGFSGNKKVGLQEIFKCYELRQGLRHIGSVILLLLYNLVIVYVLGNCESDLELCDEILNAQLQMYPDCAWHLLFKARYEFMNGNLDSAKNWYLNSTKVPLFWPQLQHLCWWELMWIDTILGKYEDAIRYADILVKDSKWSRTIFSYNKACIMLMRSTEPTEEELLEIDNLLNDAIKYKQRIAGKSLPMEKFCIRKSERYRMQNRYLFAPGIELIFVWSLLQPIGKNRELCAHIYNEIIIKEFQDKNKISEIKEYNADNRALIYLLQGVCLHQMKNYLEAELNLKNAIALEKQIKHDTYIIPYAHVQSALISIEQGDKNSGITILEETKRRYTGYALESRLHFQIHSILMDLK